VVSVPTPAGSDVVITVVYPPGFNGPSAITTQQTLMLWYTNPPQLSHQTYVDNGPTALPSGCSGATSVLAGRTTNQLVQTIATIDTIFGESETYTRTIYTATGLGVVCSVLSDIVLQYYDYSGQTSSPLSFNSTPIQTTTTSETLAMTAESVLGLSSAARRTLALSSQTGYVSDASFRLLLARARTRRHASLFLGAKTEGLTL